MGLQFELELVVPLLFCSHCWSIEPDHLAIHPNSFRRSVFVTPLTSYLVFKILMAVLGATSWLGGHSGWNGWIQLRFSVCQLISSKFRLNPPSSHRKHYGWVLLPGVHNFSYHLSCLFPQTHSRLSKQGYRVSSHGFFRSISNVLQFSALGRRYSLLSNSSIIHKHRKVVGSVHGVFASPMPHNLR